MGRKAQRPHELRLRNRQGKAVCSYRNREYRFGAWDLKHDCPSPEATAAFQRQIGLWTVHPDATAAADDSPTLAAMWAAWLTSPQAPRTAPHLLDQCEAHLFGTSAAPGPHLHTRVPDFTAADLLAWQTRLCGLTDARGELRLGRATVSKFVGLVRRCFDWGVTVGRVSADQFAGIERVKPPARGQVKEPVPRGSVGFDAVERVAHRLASDVGDLLRLMWWSGARPGELCGITVGMVRQGGVLRSHLRGEVSVNLDEYGVWAVNLGEKHKTGWKGKERVIFFGKNAIEVIRPHLGRGRGEPLFVKADGGRYTSKQVMEYSKRMCDRMGVRRFSPYQVRHSAAARVMAAFSSEIAGSGYLAAQAMLGHSPRGVTNTYTGGDWITAAKVAQKCG